MPGRAWNGPDTAEDSVIFYDGDLLSGVLDKSQFGATAYGLVHSIHELYGAESAGRLLSILSRLFTKFLQHRSFTCRMDDLHLTDAGNANRAGLLKSAKGRGLKAALGYVGLDDERGETADRALKERLEEVLRDDGKMAMLDMAVKGETSELTSAVISKCLPEGLLKPFPFNNMQTMTVSGAKGSQVNVSQISCLLGQQELEGRRVPTMVSGKTLPSFKPFETAPRAGGYIAQRFLTGIRPQEYFFHCMAGREGLIDTAVKTSRSGYLQRCLIKHLEGIRVHYDHTVRDADASVIQFRYGEDAIDVTRSRHLTQFEFVIRNEQTLLNRLRPDLLADANIDDSAAVLHMVSTLKAVARHEPVEPTLSIYSPSTNLGSTSEKYATSVADYIASNPSKLLKSKKKHRKDWPEFIKPDTLMGLENFRSLANIRYMRSLVDPGEAVGLLAAQGCVGS